jgi:hypothetical protein
MTWRKREIMDMARETGIDEWWDSGNEHREVLQKHLEAFAARVDAKATAQEREACAKLVDHILKEGGGTWGDAIRARSNHD